MYRPTIFWNLFSVISSPALVSGPIRFGAPDGLMIGPSGQLRAPVNLSARQAKAAGLLMSGTFGPPLNGSSNSAGLQKFMENRLRRRLSNLGSTLYTLTWKTWTTPSGVCRFRQRASAPRTSETGRTGWRTPNVVDSKLGTRNGPGQVQLCHQVKLTGWATPAARDWISPKASAEFLAKRLTQSRGKPLSEQAYAMLAGWHTPTCPSRSPNGHQAGNNRFVSGTVALVKATEPARLTEHGEMLIGSAARMDCGGPLNPEHSRWLMMLPAVWSSCAVLATQSTAKRRASGSKRPKKQ